MAPAGKPASSKWLSIVASRPRLMGGFLAGGVVGLALAKVFPGLPAATTSIVGWDVACVVFMASAGAAMLDHTLEDIRARAEREVEGRGLILGLVLTAAAASVWAIAVQLSMAKAEHGVLRSGHVALAFITVVLSWLMVQFVFALHYAHEYYAENGCGSGQETKGLAFPGGEPPDYWDFIHFAIVIGAAAQTADIAITSKALRRIGTLHTLVAFAFNTVIVALTINLLAGLF